MFLRTISKCIFRPATNNIFQNNAVELKFADTRDISSQKWDAVLAYNPSRPLSEMLQLCRNKCKVLHKFYEKYSLLGDVKIAHQQLEQNYIALDIAKKQRFALTKQLEDVQQAIKHLESAKCERTELQYLEIARKQYDIHNEEQRLLAEIELNGRTELDLFMHSQIALKTLHEKEIVYRNFSKYWITTCSLISALLCVFITFIVCQFDDELLKKEQGQMASLMNHFKAQQDEAQLLVAKHSKPNQNSALFSWTSWPWSGANWAVRKTGAFLGSAAAAIGKRLQNETDASWSSWTWSGAEWVVHKTCDATVGFYQCFLPRSK